MKNLTRLLVPLVIVAVVVVGAVSALGGEKAKHVTAIFPKTVSLYAGSDVRIMGVPIGTIDTVTPEATGVRVEMSYRSDVEVPESADAVVISPSIVGDRYVQFVWASDSGPTMPDNATLDQSRTKVPLELDDVYGGIDQLTVALGPNGANKNGALSDLLDSTARNFGGEGEQFHQTIVDLGKLTGTLDDNKDQFFGSARELEGFIKTLAGNDQTVRAFNQSLAQVSSLLAGERGELSASLHNLAIALNQVQSFVKENKDVLSHNIKGLDKVVKILVKQRGALDEILRVAPVALVNLAGTYNPQAGTLDTRGNVDMLGGQIGSDPGLFLCTLVEQAPGGRQACNAITAALPRTGEFGGKLPARHAVERFDPTLGGLVEVAR
jgi:phospholipid/cholesterol/gamma-HCH transport system substrate-binding protein